MQSGAGMAKHFKGKPWEKEAKTEARVKLQMDAGLRVRVGQESEDEWKEADRIRKENKVQESQRTTVIDDGPSI